ncbi:MAG: DUF1501 domain-containing protein, partial [Planctomycetaceae bacterium]
REDAATRERYGRGSADPAFGEDAGPHWQDQFLVARRLVEAGVRCVTLSFGSWDRHHSNFALLPLQLARLDQAITALVGDLHDRGLDRDVSVVAWGEFGRTPRINPAGGRDHWGSVFSVALAGAGIPGGAVIGASDAHGAQPTLRPVRPPDLAATIFQLLGIAPATEFRDGLGRPLALVSGGEALTELVG